MKNIFLIFLALVCYGLSANLNAQVLLDPIEDPCLQRILSKETGFKGLLIDECGGDFVSVSFSGPSSVNQNDYDNYNVNVSGGLHSSTRYYVSGGTIVYQTKTRVRVKWTSIGTGRYVRARVYTSGGTFTRYQYVNVSCALPTAYSVTGGGSFCSGGSGKNIGLSDSQSGVSYQLRRNDTNTGSPKNGTGSAISFGKQKKAGTYTVVATNNSTGCTKTMIGNKIVYVNPSPEIFSVTGGGGFCEPSPGLGFHVGLNGSEKGFNYQLLLDGSNVGGAVSGTGNSISFGIQYELGTYTVRSTALLSGCTATMEGDAKIIQNPIPAIPAEPGVSSNSCGPKTLTSPLFPGLATPYWQGTNQNGHSIEYPGIYTATQSGTYYVRSKNAEGCWSESRAVTVTIDHEPNIYSVTGGGSYCLGDSGVEIGLSDSQTGVSYQLLLDGLAVGPTISGSGTSISFGNQTSTGIYSIQAITAAGCTITMQDDKIVSVDPLPSAFEVTGGGSYCQGDEGAEIGLSNSENNVEYQLLLDGTSIGSPILGSGSSLSFGIQSGIGVYSVSSRNVVTECTAAMIGSVDVSLNPSPSVFDVAGGGDYCSGGTGLSIGLDGSENGTSYQLYLDDSPINSPLSGHGGSLDFGLFTSQGTYSVEAVNTTTGCSAMMNGNTAININELPTEFSVTGGGTYCDEGNGVAIGLSSSTPDIAYQLLLNDIEIGDPIVGTGTAINFGEQTIPGDYKITATNTSTSCSVEMDGTRSITVDPNPIIFNATGGGGYCIDDDGSPIGLEGSEVGIDYQLQLDGIVVSTTLTGTGGPISFGNQTSTGFYTVFGTNPLTGCTTQMNSVIEVYVDSPPTIFTVTGGGNYCEGEDGLSIGLDQSEIDVNYQLFLDGLAIGTPVAGNGGPLDLGKQQTTGIYSVHAINSLTNCESVMDGNVLVDITPGPQVFDVFGGGSVCEGENGVNIWLHDTQYNVEYQLMNNDQPVGNPVFGYGGLIGFGLQTEAGEYSVIATHALTGCSQLMNGSATIEVHQPSIPQFSVSYGFNEVVITRDEPSDGSSWYWVLSPHHAVETDNSLSKTISEPNTSLYLRSLKNGCWGDAIEYTFSAKEPDQIDAKLLYNHSIEISWSGLEGNETGFTVKRSSDAEATYSTIYTGLETSFTDTNIELGETYHYRVQSIANDQFSLSSSAKEVKVPRIIVGPKPYSYADSNTKIELQKPGNIPDIATVNNSIDVFGSRSGRISGTWNLHDDILEFTPNEPLIIGEQVMTYVRPEINIEGSADKYISNYYQWTFHVSPNNSADNPINFSLRKTLAPANWPIDPTALAIDLNNNGKAGIFAYSNPSFYIEHNGVEFVEIPINIPEIQDPNTFPFPKLIGQIDADNDGDLDLVFKKGNNSFPPQGETVIILENNNLDFSTTLHEFSLGLSMYASVAVNDVDKDGQEDMVILSYRNTSPIEYTANAYLSSDTYSNPIQTTISSCSGCQNEQLGLIDTDIDGDFELLIGNSIYLIDQSGNLSFHDNYPSGLVGRSIRDINGDQLPDLIGTKNSNLITHLNSSSEYSSQNILFQDFENSSNVFVNDFTGSFESQILILESEETYFSDAPLTGSFTDENNNQWWTLNNWSSNHLMDFDSDGDLDIISFDGGGLHWYENSSNETEVYQIDFNVQQSTTNIDSQNKTIQIELSDVSVDLSAVQVSYQISAGALFTINSDTLEDGESLKLYDENDLMIIAEDEKTTSKWTVKVTRPTFELAANGQYQRIGSNEVIQVNFTEAPNMAHLNQYARVWGKLGGLIDGEWTEGGAVGEINFAADNAYKTADEITISLPSKVFNETNTKVLSPGVIKKIINSGVSYKDPVEFSSTRTINSPYSYGIQVPFDIDNDGDIDIVTHQYGNGAVFANINDGGSFLAPHLELHTEFSGTQEIYAPSDFNGDGSIEYLLRNSSDELFTQGHGILPKEVTRGSVHIEDMDGNGAQDIIYINGPSIELISLSLETDYLRFRSLTTERNIDNLDIYDIDEDGDLDIIFVYSASRYLEAFINNGQDGFEEISLNISCSDLHSISNIKLGDFDYDGEAEFLVSRGNAYLLRNNGLEYESISVGNSHFLLAGDVSGNNVTELINTPTSRYSLGSTVTQIDQVQPLSSGTLYSSYLADLDGDGDVDILSPSGWHENFSHSTQITSFELPNQIGEELISPNGHITVTVDINTDLSNLIATFDTSIGVAEVEVGNSSQISGVTPNDFSETVSYFVTAEDGHTKQKWDVQVIVPTFRVLSTTPLSNSIGIESNSPISVDFDDTPVETMLGSIRVEGDKSGILQGSWLLSGQSATFTPQRPYLAGEKITVRVPSNSIRNQSDDKILKFGYELSFIAEVGSSEHNATYFEENTIATSLSGEVQDVLSHDLNNDSYLDIVVIQGSNIHVLINNGDNTFSEHIENLSFSIKSGVINDWDDNNIPNIILLSNGSTLYDLEYISGGFSHNPTHFVNNISSSNQLDIIDWHQDGKIDLMYNGKYVLINNGTGTQQLAILNDFDHKEADVYSKNGWVTILSSDSEPFLSPLDESLLYNYTQSANGGLNSYTINASRVDPFGPPQLNGTYHATENARVGFFTNDTDPDYFFRDLSELNQFSNPDSTFTWINNPVRSPGQDISSNVLSGISNFKEFEIRDINGDQLQDIVFIYNGTLSWFESTDGSFSENIISTTLESPANIEIFDLDGDGDTDILLTSVFSGETQLVLFENTIPAAQQENASVASNDDEEDLLEEEDISVNFSIYPNPSNALVHVIGEIQDATVKVFDLNGKEVLSKTNGNDKHLILRTSSLNEGIYLMRVGLSSGQLKERKLIIKH